MRAICRGLDTEKTQKEIFPLGSGEAARKRGRREGDGVGLVGGTRRAKSVRASFVMYSKIVS
jgi:hypothetical protein